IQPTGWERNVVSGGAITTREAESCVAPRIIDGALLNHGAGCGRDSVGDVGAAPVGETPAVQQAVGVIRAAAEVILDGGIVEHTVVNAHFVVRSIRGGIGGKMRATEPKGGVGQGSQVGNVCWAGVLRSEEDSIAVEGKSAVGRPGDRIVVFTIHG